MAKEELGLNVLRRNTPFICNIRFRCDLPEVLKVKSFYLLYIF